MTIPGMDVFEEMMYRNLFDPLRTGRMVSYEENKAGEVTAQKMKMDDYLRGIVQDRKGRIR